MLTRKIEEIRKSLDDQDRLIPATRASLDALRTEVSAKENSILGQEADRGKLDRELYGAEVAEFTVLGTDIWRID
ncbi:MAG TPA: hypothetical protein VJK09_01985 [Candidatus Paceibacterota bacterium]